MLLNKIEDQSPYLRILRMSGVPIIVAHAFDFYWYPYGDAWSEHWDHKCASTLQISFLTLRSESLLLDLEEDERCVNSFVQIRWDLNQITKNKRRIFLLFLFSLRSDLHQILVWRWKEERRLGVGIVLCGKKKLTPKNSTRPL